MLSINLECFTHLLPFELNFLLLKLWLLFSSFTITMISASIQTEETLTELAKSKLTLPKLDWKKGSCTVCGESFDYCARKKPATCKKGECLHKFHYRIDQDKWADFQPDLFLNHSGWFFLFFLNLIPHLTASSQSKLLWEILWV